MGFLSHRFRIDHARLETGNSVDQHESGQLPTREDEVPNRDLIGSEQIGDSLIDSLVVTANQR
jgi:hypothetical protein